jgi:proteasome lid subunit RPN8/RPN11
LSSGDDIVFGEVKFREPVRMRRPDRDRRFACVAYEVPRPEDMPIFLDRKPADAIERHALRDTSVELGGILLGHECVDEVTGEPFVWVTESLEAKHYENTQASFTYTHDSWEEITRDRDKLYPDLDIVGWYHTHPDFGIFLSSHDLFIHRNFFDQPLQVAYVVDPIRQTRGFFRWREDGLDQVGGYYLAADRSERLALARLVNDLESIPNADSGGSGLSPRLEAELIAMLSRPAYPQSPPAERVTTAALGSIVGLIVGVLGVLAVFAVNAFNQQVADQTKQLKALSDQVHSSSDTERLALDILSRSAKGTPPGESPFTESARKAYRERDEFRARVASLLDHTENLAAENKNVRGLYNETKAKLDKANDVIKENEDEAKQTKDLRRELNETKGKLSSTQAKLETKEALLSATDEDKAAALIRQARLTTYLAIAGWVLAVLLGLGLVALWAYGNPIPPDELEPPKSPAEGPPHVIM